MPNGKQTLISCCHRSIIDDSLDLALKLAAFIQGAPHIKDIQLFGIEHQDSQSIIDDSGGQSQGQDLFDFSR